MIEKRIQGGKQSGKKGPFQLIEDDEELQLHRRGEKPRRKFSCPHYHHCLALAAALNWDSFTCRNCCGEMNKALIWRAHHEKKRDKVVNVICDIPDIHFIHFSTHLHQTATLINNESLVNDESLTTESVHISRGDSGCDGVITHDHLMDNFPDSRFSDSHFSDGHFSNGDDRSSGERISREED